MAQSRERERERDSHKRELTHSLKIHTEFTGIKDFISLYQRIVLVVWLMWSDYQV